MEFEEVRARTSMAYQRLLAEQAQLIDLGVGERTIAAKLGCYLAEAFPEYDVDAEYNRHGLAAKLIDWPGPCREKDRPRVQPDIVIHQRGEDSRNLLVIETKMASADPFDIGCDREKLASLRVQYRYSYSLLILFPRVAEYAESQLEWNGNRPE